MTTFGQLITSTEQKLSQSAGVSVQKYAQARIAGYIQDSFNSLFLLHFWPQFCEWTDFTLNGVDGKPTTVPPFTRFMDIRVAYIGGTNRKLRQTPGSFNPNLLTAGDTSLYIEGCSGDRIFRCWPKTSTRMISVHARNYPGAFSINDTVDFDDLLLSTHAAWKYSMDDGHNPQQADKFLQEFNTQLMLLENALNQLPYDLDPRLAHVPNTWNEIDG